MVDFKFHCPICSQKMQASGDMIGDRIECPVCQQMISVPDAIHPKDAADSSAVADNVAPCVACARAIPSGSAFCELCGKPQSSARSAPDAAVISVPAAPLPAPQKKQPATVSDVARPGPGMMVLAVPVLLILIIALSWIYFRARPEQTTTAEVEVLSIAASNDSAAKPQPMAPTSTPEVAIVAVSVPTSAPSASTEKRVSALPAPAPPHNAEQSSTLGTTFWFTIAMRPVTADIVAEPYDSPAGKPDITKKDISHKSSARILLVDDNLLNQEVLLAMLRKLGMETITTAFNGAQALRMLRECAYDMILMDVQMPVMDGLEATRYIRGAAADTKQTAADPMPPYPSNIPIIGVTAHASPTDRNACLRAGMNDCLTKPISMDTLAAVLARWLPKTCREATPMPKMRQPIVIDDISSNLKIFDQAAFLERIIGDLNTAKKIVEIFTAESVKVIRDLKQAVQKQDQQTVVRKAHLLKGMCANINAEIMRKIADNMEQAANNDNHAELERLMPLMERYAQRTLSALAAAPDFRAGTPEGDGNA